MKISISLAATAVVATVALSGCSSSSSGTAGHQPPKIAAASSLTSARSTTDRSAKLRAN